MFRTWISAGVAILVGLGASTALPASAKADGLYLGLGVYDGPKFGYYHGYGDPDDGYRRHHRENRCTPGRALYKAGRLGVHHAFVAHAGPNRIRVKGVKHGYPVRLVFGRGASCPIIRW